MAAASRRRATARRSDGGRDAPIDFAPITYDEPGTYDYRRIVEVKGDAEGVTYGCDGVYHVVVTDDGNGQLEGGVDHRLPGRRSSRTSSSSPRIPSPPTQPSRPIPATAAPAIS